MPTYTCLVTDSRYSVPSLLFIDSVDAASLRALARADLLANRHHVRFEAWAGGEHIFTLDREALTQAPPIGDGPPP